MQANALTRPNLPKPSCRVMLICGPPASGKSTYVRAHAHPEDIVVDFDLIARERGFVRPWPQHHVPSLLLERNERLAALCSEPPDRTAWVILCAPTQALREWWIHTLGVRPGDMVLLNPGRRELVRRVVNDPERLAVRSKQLDLIDDWLEEEAA